jgi:hypothetical protein
MRIVSVWESDGFNGIRKQFPFQYAAFVGNQHRDPALEIAVVTLACSGQW